MSWIKQFREVLPPYTQQVPASFIAEYEYGKVKVRMNMATIEPNYSPGSVSVPIEVLREVVDKYDQENSKCSS